MVAIYGAGLIIGVLGILGCMGTVMVQNAFFPKAAYVSKAAMRAFVLFWLTAVVAFVAGVASIMTGATR